MALALGSANGGVAAPACCWCAAVAVVVAVPHGVIAGLVAGLAGPGPVADPREALARALGDPSLALGYWFAAESRYVDRGGEPVELPGVGSGRRSTVVERDGQPVAVLIHDRDLGHNPGLVDSVCMAAGLALENEQRQAKLSAGWLTAPRCAPGTGPTCPVIGPGLPRRSDRSILRSQPQTTTGQLTRRTERSNVGIRRK